MKKASGILLALCACFSVHTLAAPTADFTVESASELGGSDTAVCSASTDSELAAERAVFASYEFDTSNQGITFSTGQRGTVGSDWCAGGTIDNSWNEDGYITAVFHKSAENTGSTEWLEMCGDPHSGNIGKQIQASDVDTAEIRIRLRKLVDEPTYAWSGNATFQILTAMNGNYGSWGLTQTTFPLNFGEWQTVRIDLTAPVSGAEWSGYSSVFQFHPVVCGYEGYALDIDYIRFLYREGVYENKTYTVSAEVDGQTLVRGSNSAYFDSGIFTFTFEEAPAVSAADFVKTFLASNTAFAADATAVSADGKTYTVYANSNLRGKSLSFGDVVTGSTTYKLGVDVTFAAQAAKGKNRVVNGDFANPCLVLWGGAPGEADDFSASIETYGDGNALKGVFGTSTDKYFRLAYRDGKGLFEENTKYLFRIDMTFPSEQSDFDASVWNSNSCNTSIANFVYCPVYDWNTACDQNAQNILFTKSTVAGISALYPTVYKNFNADNLYLNTKADTLQSFKRLMNIGSKDSYSTTLVNRLFNESILTLEARLSDAQYANAPQGMVYYINSFSVKELFDVAVKSDGGAGSFDETAELLYATGENFTFPNNPFTKEDYDFAGWEYDGKIYQPGDEVVPTEAGDGAMTIKAVWKRSAPVSYDQNSIRTVGKLGIRFKAMVTDRQRAKAETYGFIVTRQSILDRLAFTAEELTFDLDSKTYAYGEAYIKNEKDTIYEELDDGVTFTGVLVGIPATKTNYEERLIARPYIEYDDGEVVYGEPKARSVKEIALAIARSEVYASMDASTKSVIENILVICGESVE